MTSEVNKQLEKAGNDIYSAQISSSFLTISTRPKDIMKSQSDLADARKSLKKVHPITQEDHKKLDALSKRVAEIQKNVPITREPTIIKLIACCLTICCCQT